MSVTTNAVEAGELLAERLGLNIVGREGHDLRTACISCTSTNAMRVHSETGVAQCYSCQGKWSAFDLAEHVIRDRRETMRLLIELGLREDRRNGHGGARGNVTPQLGDPIAVMARTKRIAANQANGEAALRAFGAKPIIGKGAVCYPAYGPDGQPGRGRDGVTSTEFTVYPSSSDERLRKGLWRKGGGSGLFLPHSHRDHEANGRRQDERHDDRRDDENLGSVVDGEVGQYLVDKNEQRDAQKVHPAVDLPSPDRVVHIVEGVKDAAALWALGYYAVGLPTSSAHPRYARLFAGCEVVLIPDRDSAGITGANKTAAAIFKFANSIQIANLPAEFRESGGADVRDVLHQPDGESLVRQAIADAQPWQPPKAVSHAAGSRAEKPTILISPEEHVTIGQSIDALTGDDSLYQRAGHLAHIVRDSAPPQRGIRSAGGPRIVESSLPWLRTRITNAARLVKLIETESGVSERDVNPPQWLVQGIHAAGEWPGIRHLEAVTESPILRTDGSILQQPGYDAATGIVYEPSAEYPLIAEHPTRDDAEDACAMLLEIVEDFPFEANEHRSAWLAALLTVVARFAFHGPAPLFLIDANVRGAGKGLLSDCIAIIATGRGFARAAYTRDDDEMRKVITSIAMEGERLVLLDNIHGTLGNASLDAALTSTEWQCRVLGTNRQPRLPLFATWVATGNNVMLGADTARRVCHIRLSSPEERPEEREGFKHGDLLGHVRAERTKLLGAALTMLRAYFAAGCPKSGAKPWGSFEAWSAVVRECLIWVSMPDPILTRQELVEQADTEANTLRGLIEGLREMDPHGGGLTTADVFDLMNDPANANAYGTMRAVIAESCGGRRGGKPGPRDLGYLLRRFRGRIVAGHYLDSRTGHGGVLQWRVAQSGGG